jgi:cysteine desulfurase/selenocysteine lyase
MDIERIRKDFPILNDIIYMDSAATSLTPEPVLDAILGYYRKYNANVERGVHRLSQMASQKYEDAHRKVANFIGIAPKKNENEEVIFTKNATEGINTVAAGLGWKRGDKIVTSLMEHHSNFIPWLRLREKGVILDIITPNKGGFFDISDFEDAIDDRTKLVAITHVSNVLGTISPIKEISTICREKDALLLVDGAQSVPHLRIDVKELGCDFFCFSGHKMLGPTGTGVLLMRKDVIEPLCFGGGTIKKVSLDDYELMEGKARFEAGTPNIAGGIGLGRAVDYLNGVGMDEVRAYEEELSKRLVEGLLEIEKVDVYGSYSKKERIGTVSFNIKGLNPHDVAMMLDEASDIMVRSGHHCCMPLMKYLGLEEGTVRVSLYLYNTVEEVEKLLETVAGIAKVA